MTPSDLDALHTAAATLRETAATYMAGIHIVGGPIFFADVRAGQVHAVADGCVRVVEELRCYREGPPFGSRGGNR